MQKFVFKNERLTGHRQLYTTNTQPFQNHHNLFTSFRYK